MAEDIVPVKTAFTTGTEGCDEVLRNMNSEASWCSEVLLTQPADGAVFVSSVALYECFCVFGNPAGLVH